MTAVPILSDGRVVAFIEVDATLLVPTDTTDSLFRGMPQSALDDKLQEAGIAIAATCRTVYRSVLETVDDLTPDTLEITFGIKFGGETGIPIVSKVTAESTIEVKASWSKIVTGSSPGQ